jgi:hypothetical protein
MSDNVLQRKMCGGAWKRTLGEWPENAALKTLNGEEFLAKPCDLHLSVPTFTCTANAVHVWPLVRNCWKHVRQEHQKRAQVDHFSSRRH